MGLRRAPPFIIEEEEADEYLVDPEEVVEPKERAESASPEMFVPRLERHHGDQMDASLIEVERPVDLPHARPTNTTHKSANPSSFLSLLNLLSDHRSQLLLSSQK